MLNAIKLLHIYIIYDILPISLGAIRIKNEQQVDKTLNNCKEDYVMVTFRRGDRWVELETFSSKDVAEYLDKALNKKLHKRRFEMLANPKWCKGILATIDGTSFIICADFATWIELSFNVKDIAKMADVIDALKKWDKFSQTERKYVFDFDLEDQKTHITIFENGYASAEEYKSHFEKYELSVTKF